MFSSVVRGGSGVCAHDWKLHADPYRFILQLMLPRMAISHPASYKDFSYSTCLWEISSRIQGRHAIVNLPPNIKIELNKSLFANIYRDIYYIYIYVLYLKLHTHTHTRTLAQNCNCEFCCGVHLTCKNNPVTPDRKVSLKGPEKVWEALIAIASVVAIANEARKHIHMQLYTYTDTHTHVEVIWCRDKWPKASTAPTWTRPKNSHNGVLRGDLRHSLLRRLPWQFEFFIQHWGN